MARLATSRRQTATAAVARAQAAAGPPHTIKLSVAHGDMRLAKYPLAVGHYNGDTIVHAEKRLDFLLEGRLSDLLNMYLYPGPRGTVEFIHAPRSQPCGALVIGLGDVGEIESSVVSAGVTSAALRHALAVLGGARCECAQRPEAVKAAAARSWVSAGFSTLLLGTYGASALSVEDSVAAIVSGAIQANNVLRARGLWNRVRVDEVQIVELYEDVANEALTAANRLALRPPRKLIGGDKLALDPSYLYPKRNGYAQRPPARSSGRWWRRIQVTCDDQKDGEEGLRFLSLTDRARAEDTLQYTQRKLIDKAVRLAVGAASDDKMLAMMLFKLLVPNSIKDLFTSESDLVLVLDRAAAQYPWELLAEPTRKGGETADPFAVRMGIIRQFKTERFAPSPQPERELSALVIGNPKTGDSSTPNSGEIDLPGAREEAQMVASLLSGHGFDVGGGALTDAESHYVMGRLCARGYKILHLAGHGIYVPDKPDKSGMILSDGTLLSTKELRNLNPIPELVFINCCHLGRLDQSIERTLTNAAPNLLAASVAEELINMGVRAVVAAGWAVNDGDALAFARKFYEEMLDGEKFGSAVLTARKAVHDRPGASNTWGAYQCYGNPDFVLDLGKHQQESLSQREYVERLGYIKTDAEWADEAGREKLRLQLEDLNAKLPRDGTTLRNFGDAWAALGDWDRAVGSYRAALSEERAEVPIRVVELLVSNLLRQADKLCAPAGDGAASNGRAAAAAAACAEVGALVDEAVGHLNWLQTLGRSVERLSLIGACYKRKALAARTAGERRKWMRKAAEYYGEAHKFSLKESGSVDPYPALNWLTYRFLLGEPLDGDLALLDECKKVAEESEKRSTSFWNRVTEADAELLRGLAEGTLAGRLAEITGLYREASHGGVNRHELAAVVNHIDFLRTMLRGAGKRGAPDAGNVGALGELRAAFETANGAPAPAAH